MIYLKIMLIQAVILALMSQTRGFYKHRSALDMSLAESNIAYGRARVSDRVAIFTICFLGTFISWPQIAVGATISLALIFLF